MLARLDNSLLSLIEAFNQDSDIYRFVTLLSPT